MVQYLSGPPEKKPKILEGQFNLESQDHVLKFVRGI